MSEAPAANGGRAAGRRLERLLRAEQRAGLRVALLGRLAVIAVFALYIVTTRVPPTVYYMTGIAAAFGAMALVQLALLRRVDARHWSMYLFAALDVVFLVVAIVFFAGPMTANLSIPMGFRFSHSELFFILLAAATFSYAPLLVMWVGGTIAALWLAGSLWVYFTFDTIEWWDFPRDGNAEAFQKLYLDPAFFGLGTRLQEVIVVLCVAALLATAVWRSRLVVRRYAAAEQERRQVAELFGTYVPEAVARQLIDADGALAPKQGEATVMFTDIAGFTGIAERMPPGDVVAMLEEYFDAAGEVIARHNGVIGQFQGDAILAMFNLPVADPDHAKAAVLAALELQDVLDRRRFRGQQLRTRIGINTGQVVSGSVGARVRRNYTVYGDTVNAAQRLEALNNEYGTRILVSETTAEAAGAGLPMRPVGELGLRGRREPVRVFEVLNPTPSDTTVPAHQTNTRGGEV